MTPINRNSINAYLDAFADKMKVGMAAIREAAEIYVSALKHYSFAQRRFEARFPDVKKETWERLKDVGNARLIPEAFLFRASLAQKYRALPLKVQATIHASSGVQLALMDGSSVVISASHLSDRQAEIVIDEKHGRVRTVEEQREILAKAAKPSRTRRSKAAWEVDSDKGNLVVHGKCVITLPEIERIYASLTEI